MMRPVIALLAVGLAAAPVASAARALEGTVAIPAGRFRPFIPARAGEREPVPVEAFFLDAYPVSNGEFSAFVKTNPAWRRGAIKPLFGEAGYLSHWSSVTDPQPEDNARPVTRVSWFAARAYCRYQGKRLPTVDEWEYAASEGGPLREEEKKRILEWYGRPATAPLPERGALSRNGFGVHGLHGGVWEWVDDFAGASLSLSKVDQIEAGLTCGGASGIAADPSDYAAFMRFAFRSSLKATYTLGSLGFRCAKDASQ